MALNKDSERRVISDFVDGPEAAERKARVLNKNRSGKELRFCKKKRTGTVLTTKPVLSLATFLHSSFDQLRTNGEGGKERPTILVNPCGSVAHKE